MAAPARAATRRGPDQVDLILAQWHRERPDLDVAPMGLIGRILRAAQLADGILSDGLAQYGLQPGWFDLLAALRRAGRPFELNPTQLMRATMLSSGGMTKRLDRLVEADLLARTPDPSDRRGTLVRLTQRGKAVIDQAVATHVANEARLLGVLSRSERRALDDLLRTLVSGLERTGGPTGPGN
jgi:DNA-binding MarR family transcriptional regulator